MANVALADPAVIFVLDPPTGVLAGAQGASVGWGYTITIADLGFLAIKYITFEDQTPVGTFWMPDYPGTPITNAAVFTEPWNVGLNGLQYDIDPGAPVGARTKGTMDLTYELFENADFTGSLGVYDVLATNGTADAVIAEVDVLQGTTSTVPEPGCLWLAGCGVVAMILRRKVAGGS
jgi:hypothetical protein